MPKGILHWNEILIFSIASLAVLVLMLIAPYFAFQTTDDGALVSTYLEQGFGVSNKSQVLGASSDSTLSSCPDERPIVGWVNFKGYKVLPDSLPPGEDPSVCFASFEAAYQEGFISE